MESGTKRIKTTYIIDYMQGRVTTYAKIRNEFIRCPEEFRWDFCNSHREYIYQMERLGKMLTIKPNNVIVSDKIYSPLMYAKLKGIKEIKNNEITLAEFDSLVADKYNLWNYPLDEYSHVIDNKLKVVVVKFYGDIYRFVQV